MKQTNTAGRPDTIQRLVTAKIARIVTNVLDPMQKIKFWCIMPI